MKQLVQTWNVNMKRRRWVKWVVFDCLKQLLDAFTIKHMYNVREHKSEKMK